MLIALLLTLSVVASENNLRGENRQLHEYYNFDDKKNSDRGGGGDRYDGGGDRYDENSQKNNNNNLNKRDGYDDSGSRGDRGSDRNSGGNDGRGGGGGDSYGRGGGDGYGGYDDRGGTDSYGSDRGGGDAYGRDSGGTSSYGDGGDPFDGGGDPFDSGGAGDGMNDDRSSESSYSGGSSYSDYDNSDYGGYGGGGYNGGGSSSYHSKDSSKFMAFMGKINVKVPLIPFILIAGIFIYLGMVFTAYKYQVDSNSRFTRLCRTSINVFLCIYKVLLNVWRCRLDEIPPIIFDVPDDDDYTEDELERMKLRPGMGRALESEHKKAVAKAEIEMKPGYGQTKFDKFITAVAGI